MDVRAFLDSVANERIKKRENVHWESKTIREKRKISECHDNI
jgi:hypothetical protein